MISTTIKLHKKTKKELDKFKEYKNETYDEILEKLVFIAKTVKKDPALSKETVEAIEKARTRMSKRKKYMN